MAEVLAEVAFQHTAARRRLGPPRAATPAKARFNTQPPEGGWALVSTHRRRSGCFNTQPPEGGWLTVTSGVL